ncbi:peptidoglycan/xylan/chitin deacetylase (PgdA/CDA1 family) [Saccharothrix tamanrassetensis]|uniref:Peptidoglycan/xylan/chitin deacetylase (PgdA/CDA1 family) n=1 Tax=Saccharothrix tamanrassetensis TaxID=1051531 RepID=A0A841CNP5_9PSEU|nr:polysaccharide deacetylase family protein [Saccharothrix tamanrassetensis]MBB5959271.1 peptidoglycan/xylan/chitin deacetylase (PgdA/CDA1 family) [Saccharothrix tamanrassetensis]
MNNTVVSPKLSLAAAVALVAATCACADAPAQQPAATPAAGSAVSATLAASSAPPDPAAVRANELGQVPILMYHRLVAQPTSVYDRTPEGFRAELERLAAEDYVPVTTAEYASGRIDIPAGKHPVVLTFDDGDPTQFALDGAGQPVPGTAIAILREVAERHPGFRPVASLYVNAAPFGSPDGTGVLPWLRDNGFEIGNHTQYHTNLGAASDQEVQQAIASGNREIVQAVPGYQVSSLALPFGAIPGNTALAMRGASDGMSYEYSCVLLVGSNPAPSPYAADFDPLNTPRIRSQDASGEDSAFGSAVWLDKLAAAPQTRYTSDGVPDRVSYPAAGGNAPAQRFADRALAY